MGAAGAARGREFSTAHYYEEFVRIVRDVTENGGASEQADPLRDRAGLQGRCDTGPLCGQRSGPAGRRRLHCILVDDGSPDESGGLCDAWAARDPRVTVLHQENRGVSAARNAGLAAADSEYLVFLDADDALRPGRFVRRRLTPRTLRRRALCSGTTPLTSRTLQR